MHMLVNGIQIQLGQPIQFPIKVLVLNYQRGTVIQAGQLPQIKAYMNSLVDKMNDDAYAIINGVIIQKKDITKF